MNEFFIFIYIVYSLLIYFHILYNDFLILLYTYECFVGIIYFVYYIPLLRHVISMLYYFHCDELKQARRFSSECRWRVCLSFVNSWMSLFPVNVAFMSLSYFLLNLFTHGSMVYHNNWLMVTCYISTLMKPLELPVVHNWSRFPQIEAFLLGGSGPMVLHYCHGLSIKLF